MPETWLYQPGSLAAILPSKCLVFQNPPFVTHTQRQESGPEELDQEFPAVAVTGTGWQRM